MVHVTIEEQAPVPVEAGAVAVVDLSGGQGGGGGNVPIDVMTRSVYDKQGRKTDIFEYVEDLVEESAQALTNAEIDTILGVN